METPEQTRTTFLLDAAQLSTLRKVAQDEQRSMSWLVRDALRLYFKMRKLETEVPQ